MDRINTFQMYIDQDLLDICNRVQVKTLDEMNDQGKVEKLTIADIYNLVNEEVAHRELEECRAQGLAPTTKRRGRKPGSKNRPRAPPSDDSDLFAEAPTNGAEAATEEAAS